MICKTLKIRQLEHVEYFICHSSVVTTGYLIGLLPFSSKIFHSTIYVVSNTRLGIHFLVISVAIFFLQSRLFYFDDYRTLNKKMQFNALYKF